MAKDAKVLTEVGQQFIDQARKELELGTEAKVNLAKDLEQMKEVDGYEVREGAPEIVRKLAELDYDPRGSGHDGVNDGVNDGVEMPPFEEELVEEGDIDMPELTKEYQAYYDKLPDDLKDVFRGYMSIESILPKNLNAMSLMDARRQYGDVYAIELASGWYVYRALTAKENEYIKNLKGLTQDSYNEQVILTCLLGPKLNFKSKDVLAGTKATLSELIFSYSDFSVPQNPRKL